LKKTGGERRICCDSSQEMPSEKKTTTTVVENRDTIERGKERELVFGKGMKRGRFRERRGRGNEGLGRA